ncbi:disease resistance protein RGA2-like [Quercus suber]|uniref:disease resistance protein RGA2-like n=1 Tax=Quercus suber TaxID=58331 RepID=UPI000CE1D64F|nr:disease resistance protein RGA2-like [Quercus suber]
MADAILYGVVQTIIESLGSSTLQPIGSIWGVKDDLEKMKNTVLAIQAVLQDAEEQQVENHQVKDWLMKLRDAVYDADDLLSEFTNHVLQQKGMDGHKIVKKVRIFFSSSNPVVFGLEMARKLKAMRERFNDISNDRDQFQLKLVGCPLETRVVTRGRDQTHSFVPDEEVIGREKDKQAIIDLLLDFDVEDNVSFICIVGIGGLGKTTLAQYVYNDKNVEYYFELQMWVCVSDDFDVKKIVEKIIESATKRKPENLELDLLQNKLREQLNQKKYLLVLDDIWNENEESWCALKRLLMGGARGSKVVITTRTNMVAEITSTISPYFLKGLSKDQSWLLLKKMAFKKGQEAINSNLEAIGMDIVQKCQGVPLAIRTIGKVLLFRKTEDEWLHIKNTKLTDVTQLKDGIMPVLKLSYDYLPSHLKCCFAYCSLFPKDYLIDKLTLIQLWISQGFIQSSEESHQLEHVANEYFMELLWRSFFQEAEEDRGMNRRFKMHDLIHDLAQYVSRIDCTLVDSNAKKVNEKGRHLSFPFYNVLFFEENLSTLVKANKIRIFILAYNKWTYYQGTIEESTLKKLISTFRYLRVLDLHGLNMKMLPNTIGTLMHLKYLDLSSNDIEVLPSSITKLVNLQTLKLCECEKLRELSIDIQKLVNLKHLDLEDCGNLTHMPRGLGQLTSLQTLNLFVVSEGPVGSSKHCGGLAELNKLNDLRGKLGIKNLARVKDATSEFKAANLKEKQCLSELILKWKHASDDENSMDSLQPHESLKSLQVDGYMGVRVSSWISFLTNLVGLKIVNCKKCQYLPSLYQLPTLRKLSIWFMDGLEYMTDGDMNDEIFASLASPSIFFPSLEELCIENCPNLKGWWRRDKGNEATTTSTISSSSTNQYHQHMPYFPRLSYLVLLDCPMMTCMPLFPNLEKGLDLTNSSLKALEETIEMNMGGRASSFSSSSSSSSSSSPLLSKLKFLRFSFIQELEFLPEEWFKNLTSLETLLIWDCHNLTSLPKGMSHLTSLQTLEIRYCPQLKQRCEKENGEDWDKISHIPNFEIR